MSDLSKVLGVHFSPKRQGSSWVLLEEFGQGVREAGADFEIVSVIDAKNLQGCQECGSCNADGQCAIDDDMNIFYRAFEGVKRLVVSTPIFFYDVPSQGKAVIDRSQAYWARRYVLGRNREGLEGAQGFLLGVGATRGKDLFMPVTLSIKYFFDALAFPKIFDTLFFRKIETPAALTQEQRFAARSAGLAFAKA
ncbi:MAG: flavodoxin family protein [Deltaproteobacteria bacterium]|jgi:multimeric flavodoxin WrbA|nr:flavodoxin family protein [Deltaproteobacteria bacterium]